MKPQPELSDKEYKALGEKLLDMSELAAARFAAGKYWFEVGEHKRYVRINSGKFRAVSLDAHNPCGHLKSATGRKVESDNLQTALRDAADNTCESHKPGNRKSEHQVQAPIVWKALSDPKGLSALLDLAAYADALWFVTDELSLPPIRADIILLGERAGRFFPVFVELKYGRSTVVVDQLRDVINITKDANVAQSFAGFLAAASGKSVNLIDLDRSVPLVIWGTSASGRERHNDVKKMREKLAGLLIVCHKELEKGSGNFYFEFSEAGNDPTNS